jgi:transaldolase
MTNPLGIKIFADVGDLQAIRIAYRSGDVAGFTTNPTLLRRAGVQNYEEFGRELLSEITDLPVSFEILADDLCGMKRQARKIAAWSDNVYVKVPVTNTCGLSTAEIISELANTGVKLNVTAVFTSQQVDEIAAALSPSVPAIISMFAGRIANAGIDPIPIVRDAVQRVRDLPLCEILWASAREVLNVVQARESGCQIITLTPPLLTDLNLLGRDLADYSLDTVRMFYRDAQEAGFFL